MSEPVEPHRRRIPSHLLGGRIRTTTFVLCAVWVGMWLLYQFLNQPEETPPAPSTAVIISETPYVPYVPPAATTTVPPSESNTTTGTPYPSTTVPTAPSATPPPSAPAPQQGVSPQQVPTTPTPTTTTRQFPFELPQIPGLSENREGTVPEDTETSTP